MRLVSLSFLALAVLPAQTPQPQPVLAPGVVSFHEGSVYVSNLGRQLEGRHLLEQGGEIGTRADGFAEILLTPGTFAWLAADSLLQLESSSPEEPIALLEKGALLAESLQAARSAPAVLVFDGRRVTLRPGCLARLDGRQRLLRVFKGSAAVEEKSGVTEVPAGMELAFAAGSVPVQSARRRDPLEKRCRQRADLLSAANNAGARWVFKARTPWPRDAWLWVEDPGEFTFVPAAGRVQSALGVKFWSPAAVHASGGPDYDSTREQMWEAGLGRTPTHTPASAPRSPAPPPPPAKK